MPSRRSVLRLGAALPVTAIAAATDPAARPEPTENVSLDGEWQFRLDNSTDWRIVKVPHTWQVEPENADYMGVAWYRRAFEAPPHWANRAVRIEFEAVFHSATVSVNGVEVGRHLGKGYTVFAFDIGPQLRYGQSNRIEVRADNSFNESMLPRGRSSDWAHDGGIYRPVQLLVTPKVFIERVAIDADPDPATREAVLEIAAVVRNSSSAAWDGSIGFRVADEATGLARISVPSAIVVKIAAGEAKVVRLPSQTLRDAKLWHFDHPDLYLLSVQLSNGHVEQTSFGIRKIQTRNAAFFLNGERVRLMGVERMAGSNPEYGMAEPLAWIEHDHADMKELNCVYTRVHWPQDRRVLDWCDRHGMLIQTEVPTWGPRTFAGMTEEPSAEIMNNGLEQLREMIARDRNHPCIFSWGVCNEIGGQNPPAYSFAKRMYEEAKKLDPRRLVTYASNSLQKTPVKDVAGLMDYIMWNEYYESWFKGTPEDLARNLDDIHRAFPDKAIVISEYGYCACTADRPEGDAKRIDVLREHDRIFRERDYVAGLIFFDYNDYRTHIGDRGTGVMKQRVHGVVDVYGVQKPSWEALRRESSPVESMRVSGAPGGLKIAIRTRSAVPAYMMRGYWVRGVAYGFGEIPVERFAAKIESIAPGGVLQLDIKFSQPGISRIRVDLVRPTGYSAWTQNWQY